MINLIPNEEKKKKVKDFYFRLLITFFSVLGTAILIASVAILPAYLLSVVKKNLIAVKLEAQKNEPMHVLDQQTLATVSDLNNKLNLIEKSQSTQFLVSQKVISEILVGKMSDITITHISYQNDPVKGKIINVNGTAGSRERLLLFRTTLEDNTAFKKVDLPISNFLKGSNIKFFLSLVPA